MSSTNNRPTALSPAMALDISAYPFVAQPEAGHSIVLGFRPERVALVDAASTDGFDATVSVTEPMGDHQIVSLDIQGLAVSLATDK